MKDSLSKYIKIYKKLRANTKLKKEDEDVICRAFYIDIVHTMYEELTKDKTSPLLIFFAYICWTHFQQDLSFEQYTESLQIENLKFVSDKKQLTEIKITSNKINSNKDAYFIICSLISFIQHKKFAEFNSSVFKGHSCQKMGNNVQTFKKHFQILDKLLGETDFAQRLFEHRIAADQQMISDIREVTQYTQDMIQKLIQLQDDISYNTSRQLFNALIPLYNLIWYSNQYHNGRIKVNQNQDYTNLTENCGDYLEQLLDVMRQFGAEIIKSQPNERFIGALHEPTKETSKTFDPKTAYILYSLRAGVKFKDDVLQKELVSLQITGNIL